MSALNLRPAYIPPDRIHHHGVWEPDWPQLHGARKRPVLLVRRWRRRCPEPPRAPEGVGLSELRVLHAQHQLRFIARADRVQILVTEPSAPARF
jgi:hypothetical protein